MMKLLLLALALGCAAKVPVKEDGAVLQEVCQPHSRPWQVYLWNTKVGWYGEERCSGALINEWWVLTAWNCFVEPGHTMVSLGEHDLTVEEGTEQHIWVARYVQHGPYTRGPSHSLAMVKLAEPARFTQHVMPVALPTRCTQLHEKCLVSGWGSTVPGQDEPKLILKCETQRVIDDKMCQTAFPLYWIEHAFCAKTIISTDNCLSDQGSTVVCGGELQGLFWSSSSDVGLYTRLCLYLDWISDIMNTPDPTPEPAWTTAAAATTW
ncbi:trypsinogen-like protein 3 [Salvelinus fontinalis]|uniref:trypsinogen-like protein 3 n=1 Tax=Salvelinus fontinalis TaxID=8038 RepID=UPI0024868DA2|nr:trypsinogen-like protein 3 [Salvelinus fontinalis]